MTISYKYLKKVAFLLLALPSVIFVLGFLKWYIGVPVALLVAAAYIFAILDKKSETADPDEPERSFVMPVWCLLVLIGTVTLWCYFGGLGNLFYQSSDWAARNAIFRDLIRFEWPVIYENKDAGLVYYIAYWLPAALVGKSVLGISGNLDAAWMAGNISLWLWSVICITVVILLTMLLVNTRTKKHIFIVLAIFIFFSGLDVIGTFANRFFYGAGIPGHVEWWCRFQYSSMTTCIFWVFNQAVFAWLVTACFMLEKKVRNYAFIIVLGLSCSPLPCMGLAIYMLGVAMFKLWKAVKASEFKEFVLDVFTPQNIILTVTMLPIYFFYYKSNLAVSVGHMEPALTVTRDWICFVILVAAVLVSLTLGIVLLKKNKRCVECFFFAALMCVLLVWSIFDLELQTSYLAFLLLEGGIYLFLVWRDNRAEPIFYLTWISIAVCPLITVGTASDFCMRASIPAVFVMMVLCIRYLFAHAGSLFTKKITVETVTVALLVLVLALGVYTPYKEFQRAFVHVADSGALACVNDWIYSMGGTFSGSLEGTDRNFIANNYGKTFFFKYLAK